MTEFSGIERRLDELNERLNRLRPLQEKSRTAFDEDPYLRDVVERNLEVVAQCCIDIWNRIISLEGASTPQDYYEAIERQGELGVLLSDFARELVLSHDDAVVFRIGGKEQNQAGRASVRFPFKTATRHDDCAAVLAPLAGFRNVPLHQYLRVGWEEVYVHLHRLDDLERFVGPVREWMRERESSPD